jgi:hypothetical protein
VFAARWVWGSLPFQTFWISWLLPLLPDIGGTLLGRVWKHWEQQEEYLSASFSPCQFRTQCSVYSPNSPKHSRITLGLDSCFLWGHNWRASGPSGHLPSSQNVKLPVVSSSSQ